MMKVGKIFEISLLPEFISKGLFSNIIRQDLKSILQ